MRLVIDSETSGLPKPGLPLDDPSQPRIVQLAAGLYSPKWKRVGGFAMLIKPNGWSIEREAERKHGISEAICAKYGVPIVAALVALQGLCDNALQIIGHAVQFDRDRVTSELAFARADGSWWKRKAGAFACTMELAKDVCQLPGEFGDFKNPSLEELHRYLFPADPFTVTHEAAHDEAATVKIAQELERRGILPPPRARSFAIDATWRKL